MNVRDDKGITVEQHLKQLGKEADTIGPPLPYEMRGVWQTFLLIHSRRAMGFSGPNPLTAREIMDWDELMGLNLSGFKIRAIMDLDAVYMRVRNG